MSIFQHGAHHPVKMEAPAQGQTPVCAHLDGLVQAVVKVQ